MNKRLLNSILCLVFIALLIGLPVRNLLFTDIPENARGGGFTTASYIMLFLFAGLSLVFGARAIKGVPSKKGE
jgi:hypothetical protein